jgi:hypothetical protein
VQFMNLSKKSNMKYRNLEEFLIRFVAFTKNVKQNPAAKCDENALYFEDESIDSDAPDIITNKQCDPVFVKLFEETNPKCMGPCEDYEKLLKFLLELKHRRRMEKRYRLEEALQGDDEGDYEC